MNQFKLYDTVLYQGHERMITDRRGEDEYRIALNHGTHTTWEWVKGDELTFTSHAIPLTGPAFSIVLEGCNTKEQEMVNAWSAAADAIGKGGKAKSALAAFKKAEREYLKTLQSLHKAAKSFQP